MQQRTTLLPCARIGICCSWSRCAAPRSVLMSSSITTSSCTAIYMSHQLITNLKGLKLGYESLGRISIARIKSLSVRCQILPCWASHLDCPGIWCASCNRSFILGPSFRPSFADTNSLLSGCRYNLQMRPQAYNVPLEVERNNI